MKSNVKRIARLEIPGGGQVVVQGNYAYIGHMNPPHGHFIPEPTGGFSSPQSNDVDVDERGLIYLLDRNQGFDILEFNRS